VACGKVPAEEQLFGEELLLIVEFRRHSPAQRLQIMVQGLAG